MHRSMLFALVLLLLPATGLESASAASLLLTGQGQCANEGDALPPTIYDFDGDGHPDVCSEDLNYLEGQTWVRVYAMDGEVLWSNLFSIPGQGSSGSFELRGFVEIDDRPGRKAVLAFSGRDTLGTIYEGVRIYSPSTDQTVQTIDDMYLEWIADFDGDGWDEIVLEPNVLDPVEFEVWGHSTGSAVEGGAPAVGRLKVEANRPNPFNPETTVRFELAEPRTVVVEILSLSGRVVRTIDLGVLPAGSHEAKWDGRADSGRPAPSGTYFYSVNAGGERGARKVLLIR